MAEENGFIESLGEYADHPEIKGKVNDPQTLAKRFVDGLSEINRRIRVPSADAGDEDRAAFIDRLKDQVPGLVSMPGEDDEEAWGKFFDRIGRPESPEGYEGPDGSKDILEALAPTAHGLGLTKKQLAGLMDKLESLRGEALEQQTGTLAETKAALKRDWGDAYPEKMMHARLFAASKGLADTFANNPAFGSNKELLQVFAELGAELAENESITTAMATSTGMLTRAEAEARRRDIQSNPDHPYNNPMNPEHDRALQEMVKLNQYIVKLREG